MCCVSPCDCAVCASPRLPCVVSVDQAQSAINAAGYGVKRRNRPRGETVFEAEGAAVAGRADAVVAHVVGRRQSADGARVDGAALHARCAVANCAHKEARIIRKAAVRRKVSPGRRRRPAVYHSPQPNAAPSQFSKSLCGLLLDCRQTILLAEGPCIAVRALADAAFAVGTLVAGCLAVGVAVARLICAYKRRGWGWGR